MKLLYGFQPAWLMKKKENKYILIILLFTHFLQIANAVQPLHFYHMQYLFWMYYSGSITIF